MNIRKLALDTIDKIITSGAYSNVIVNQTLSKFVLEKQDKAFFTNLVYGTVQNYLTIEYYLAPFVQKKQKPWVKHLLYMSVYQLVYLETKEYAVINEAVEIANVKSHSIGSFVNAVLRNFLRNDLRTFEGLDKLEYLSIKYSTPKWLVCYLLKDYTSEVIEKLLSHNLKVKKDSIRINTLKAKPEEILETFDEEQIGYIKSDFVDNGLIMDEEVVSHKFHKNGKITIQDLASQKVSEVINPKPNSIILDLCSAPGGKSAHLAALMNNTGTIYACDIYTNKMKQMNSNFKRLGVSNVVLQELDALESYKHFPIETFDYVLADVPCSGLGVMGHKVDLKYHIDMDSINQIIALQKQILESTYNLVKVNGYYTYSTCTINKDENENQINEFIAKHPNFEIVEQYTIMPYEHQCDGFYICKMRRNNE